MPALVDSALAAVERERPDIAVPPVRLACTGFSSHVLTTGSGFVIRVARTPDGAAGHRKEWDLLSRLASFLPVAIPQPVWRLPTGPQARFGAMAYRRVAGIPLAWDARVGDGLVGQLGSFLAALHGIRAAPVIAAVVPFADWKQELLTTTGAAVDHLEGPLRGADHRRLRGWHDQLTRHLAGFP